MTNPTIPSHLLVCLPVQVAQLAGYVAEHSAYHHGEASLMSTIIGLAQDFVGSNNVNLLVPSGEGACRASAPVGLAARGRTAPWQLLLLLLLLCGWEGPFSELHPLRKHARHPMQLCPSLLPRLQASSARGCRAARTPRAPVTSSRAWSSSQGRCSTRPTTRC